MNDQKPKQTSLFNWAMTHIVGTVLVVFGGLWLIAGAPLKSLPIALLTILTFIALFAWIPIYVWIARRFGFLLSKESSAFGNTIAVLGLFVTFTAWASLVDRAYDHLLPSFTR